MVAVDERLLQAIALAVQVPPHKYEAADRSYQSVSDWLCRYDSSLRNARPAIYVQGSFRLGTAIRPVTEREEYDVDLVCELSLGHNEITQAELKRRIGHELRGYTETHRMTRPHEKDRCWTIQYADDAQFHLDVLPALPNSLSRFMSRALGGHYPSGILITDRMHPNYCRRSDLWPCSNPKGYSEWFKSKQRPMHAVRRNIEGMPVHNARTPLAQAIQVLKRHRDIRFCNLQDYKPISIIVTTLAAHAYRGEATLSASLARILQDMTSHIDNRDGIAWVPNPVDLQENFADKWQKQPLRQLFFHDWLRQAQQDFAYIKGKPYSAALTHLEGVLGEAVTGRAARALREHGAVRAHAW